jgi:hypothetical protein
VRFGSEKEAIRLRSIDVIIAVFRKILEKAPE